MKFSRIARVLPLLAACALSLAGSIGQAQQHAPGRIHLTILGTTDIHGNLLPEDYYANRPANRGLVKIASLVKQIRATEPNTLLLDSGDTIQGTPLAFYFARKDTSPPNPTIAVMNAMHYDAAACGNHEFNFGEEVLWKAKREARFPILAANMKQDYKGGTEFFQPYIIKKMGGVRVAIVGFVTPGVPRWEIPAHYKGYQFEQIVEAARRVIPEVRKKADLVVVIAHSGLGRDPKLDKPSDATDEITGENVIYALAEAVPGIDVILLGHTHREVAQEVVNGVLLVQARNWAQSLARVDVEMERDAGGNLHVAEKHSGVIPVTAETPSDPDLVKLIEPYETATQKYLNAAIATSPREMTGATARYEDEPLVDLIHKVQLDVGRADISFATMFLPTARIPAGPVTVRQLAALYIYENTLYVVEMTGAQVKEALEHAASFFPAWPPADASRPLDLPGYNADSAEGVSYTMDLTRPVGGRIRDLLRNGTPIDPAQKFRVAINNYRYTGGGHYDVYKGLPILYRSPEEVRELIIQYVTQHSKIPDTTDRNWSIQPRDAFDAILAEDRRRTGSRSGGPGEFR
jgi:2',3'-cyclic-nucleotide 2'-phosphodiesterase/3'-nucleotidase